MDKLITQATTYQIRTETHDGRQYIVVPVTMMVEGVHSGSGGPLFHSIAELGHFPEAWNGIPITIQHPEENGQGVSANSPNIIEGCVGRVYNTHVEGSKLKAEAWLDVQKLSAKSPLALAHIRQSRPLEVSVGVFSDNLPEPGDWNGEQYIAIARNHRPDHLALLPGGVGACSWTDGCGIRNNEKKGGTNVEGLEKTIKDLSQKGYSVNLINNATGYTEVINSLRSQLDAMDTDSRVYFLEEVFESDFIYRVRNRETNSNTLYRRGYTKIDSTIEISGEPEEVRRTVDYTTMMRRTINSNVNINKKEDEMSKNENLCCEAKVDALIANTATAYTVADREKLLTLGEELLDKMIPAEKKVVSNAAPVVDEKEVITTFKQTLKTIDDYVGLMPDTMKSSVQKGLELYAAERKFYIDNIIANNTADWKEDQLTEMEDELLKKVSDSVKKVDYSAQAGAPTIIENTSDDEVLLPGGTKIKENN